MLAKAAARGADALILDMEDAVAPSAKLDARATIRSQLDRFEPEGPEIWIRVNNQPELMDEDLAVAANPIVAGVFLPKVNRADEVERSLTVLAARPDIQIDAMIETGRGLLNAASIAAAPHVRHITLGLADMGADLNVAADPDDTVWGPVRMHVVVASAAAEIDPPVAPVSPNLTDLDGYRRGCESWAADGFGGRQVIHPAQVPIVNETFSPSPDEVAEARRLLDRFDTALAEGRGAIRDEDGTMIDEAFVRRARRIVDIADRDETGPSRAP